jgi:hypothetical protein
VQIQRMTPTRSTGWTYSSLAPNVVEPETLPHLPERERVDRAIDPQAGTVRLVDPPIAVADLLLPLRPMIGCFGVAPGIDQAMRSGSGGPSQTTESAPKFLLSGSARSIPCDHHGWMFGHG